MLTPSRWFELAALIFALGVCPGLAPSPADAQTLSAWAVVTPTIDGTISSGEWIDADVEDFTLSYCSESHDVTLYVKNDDTYLYLAAVIRNEEYSNLAEMYHDFANFYFDNDNDGTVDVGEDGLAVRFDNTISRDTYNPTGVNGWSYGDSDNGGSNDILGAVTHTNPVPDGVGDYTFEYRHPLDSADDAHDFSVAPGDTLGFRFAFPDGETTCQPVGYNWPSSSPAGYADIVLANEPSLKLLFVPLRWTNTQAEFDSQVDTQIGFFTDAIPLSACPEQISIAKLDVATQNFSTFTCSAATCAVRTIGPFVTGLGINTADYDILVGLVEASPCSPTAGCSNGTDTVWVETVHDSVAAHEIGHIFGLEDEYCSNAAGSTDCYCNDGDEGGCTDTGGDGSATGDINFLHAECVTDPCDCPPDGSADCTGSPCCNFSHGARTYDCSVVDYGVCCLGNRNAAGGRAIMSFANAEELSPGDRGFDVHSTAHFATIPELTCSSPERPIARAIVDLDFTIGRDGSIEVEKAIPTVGRPSKPWRRGGEYHIVLFGKGGKPVWTYSFDVHFDYFGPVYLDVDYSDVAFERVPVRVRIPYDRGGERVQVLHGEHALLTLPLSFCNDNGVCDVTETHEVCPGDCPLEAKDKVCTDRRDRVCDPDCGPGIDPDCAGPCGNGVCNVDEHHGSCPGDCPSGGTDGYCDGVGDLRCDPDCPGGDADPDCKGACGDGTCAACVSETDPYACEDSRSCPADCPSGGADYLCDGNVDGICDPDCTKEQDRDCQGGPAWIWVLLALLIILILALLAWRWYRSSP